MTEVEKQWHTTSSTIVKLILTLITTAALVFAAVNFVERPSAVQVVEASVRMRHISDIEEFLISHVGTRPTPPNREFRETITLENINNLSIQLTSLHAELKSLWEKVLLQPDLDLCNASSVSNRPPSNYDRRVAGPYYSLIFNALNMVGEVVDWRAKIGPAGKDVHDMTTWQVFESLLLFGGQISGNLNTIKFIIGPDARGAQWYCYEIGRDTLRTIGSWLNERSGRQSPWQPTSDTARRFSSAIRVVDPLIRRIHDTFPEAVAEIVANERKTYKELLRAFSLSRNFQLGKFFPSVPLYWFVVLFPSLIVAVYIFILLQLDFLKKLVRQPRIDGGAPSNKLNIFTINDYLILSPTRVSPVFVKMAVSLAPVICALALYGVTFLPLSEKTLSVAVRYYGSVPHAARLQNISTDISLHNVLIKSGEIQDLWFAQTAFWPLLVLAFVLWVFMQRSMIRLTRGA